MCLRLKPDRTNFLEIVTEVIMVTIRNFHRLLIVPKRKSLIAIIEVVIVKRKFHQAAAD
jgi:hypothetical protein